MLGMHTCRSHAHAHKMSSHSFMCSGIQLQDSKLPHSHWYRAEKLFERAWCAHEHIRYIGKKSQCRASLLPTKSQVLFCGCAGATTSTPGAPCIFRSCCSHSITALSVQHRRQAPWSSSSVLTDCYHSPEYADPHARQQFVRGPTRFTPHSVRAYASAAVCNIASSPSLAISAPDYQLRLRYHLQLPCLAAPTQDTPTHAVMRQQGIATAIHNALRDAILESAALADHFVKAEPIGLYPGATRVDGVIEDSAGRVTSSANNRIAFDVFTASDPTQVKYKEEWKIEKHADNVCSVGDEFAAPAFTPAGTPYPSALAFIRKLAHTGDKIDSSVGRDVPRFHHECTSATFLTPTHTAHTIHMCTASVARASAAALRNYARSRAIGHRLAANTISRPAVVQAPF